MTHEEIFSAVMNNRMQLVEIFATGDTSAHPMHFYFDMEGDNLIEVEASISDTITRAADTYDMQGYERYEVQQVRIWDAYFNDVKLVLDEQMRKDAEVRIREWLEDNYSECIDSDR